MTRRCIEIEITLHSSLMVGTDGESTLYNQTRDYIPGAALRGALADVMLSLEVGEEFEILFGDTALEPIFENLYPTRSGSPTYPLPLSARTCKYHRGFKSQKGERHGVGDILIQQAVFEALLEARANLPSLYEPRCPECHSAVEPLAGYYEFAAGEYGQTTAPVRRISRTAIERRRHVAADRLLYTLETVETHTKDRMPLLFRGSVLCADSQTSALERWLPQVRGIGAGRSRGLGRVEVRILGETENPFPNLGERLERFDAAVRTEWRFCQRVAGIEPLPDDVRFFGIDLLAPTFLTRNGLPATHPDPADLGLPSGAIQLWRAISKQTVMGGWHMGGRLPRRTALATEMGSVFMYRIQGFTLDALEERLQKLEDEGLGEERARGFGRVLISSPIHYQAEVTL
jgi:CRISPR-associated protein Csx10